MQLSFFSPQLRAHLTRDEIIAPPPRKKKAAITVPIFPLSPDQTERERPTERKYSWISSSFPLRFGASLCFSV